MADYAKEMQALEGLMAQEDAKKAQERDTQSTGNTIANIVSPLFGTGDVKNMQQSFSGGATNRIADSTARKKELLDKYKMMSGLQGKQMDRQQRLQDMKDMADYSSSLKGVSKLDSEMAKTYQTYVNEGGANTIANNIKKMKDVVNQLKSSGDKGPAVTTGGVRAAFPTSGTIGGFVNPKMTALREQLESAIQGTLKPILGAQFAKVEGEMIFKRAFNDALPNDVNIKKIQFEIDALEKRAAAHQSAIDYWNTHGQTLRGYTGQVEQATKDQLEGKTPGQQTEPKNTVTPKQPASDDLVAAEPGKQLPPGKVRVEYNGKTLIINEARLQEAIKDGAKVIK